jgi:hypothetical protein
VKRFISQEVKNNGYQCTLCLEFNPFLKNSKEVLYSGNEFREAEFRLDYLANTKGFGLLTGSPEGQDYGHTGLVCKVESFPL